MNEQDIKRAVQRIQMNPALKGMVMNATLFPRQKHSAHRLQKVALCFGAILILMLGGFWGRPNPAAPSSNNQFSLVAVAAGQTQTNIGKDSPVNLSLLSDNDGYVGYRVKLNNGDEEEKYYLQLGLKCKGENIQSITYTSQLFQFAKIIPINKTEFDSLKQQSHQIFSSFIDRLNGKGPEKTSSNHYTAENEEQPLDVYPMQDVYDASSFDFVNQEYLQESLLPSIYPNIRTYQSDGKVYWGYKTVGKSFTIAYEDQDDFSKQYAYKVSHIIKKQELDEINQKIRDQKSRGLDAEEANERYRVSFLNNVSWDMDEQVDKDILTVAVHFKDGSNQQKRFRLHYTVDLELSISEVD